MVEAFGILIIVVAANAVVELGADVGMSIQIKFGHRF
jgi:hypothetical protein